MPCRRLTLLLLLLLLLAMHLGWNASAAMPAPTRPAPAAASTGDTRITGEAPIQLSLTAGTRPHLVITPPAGKRLVLVEKETGATWFDGAAPADLQPWLIRSGTLDLVATLEGGTPQPVTLKVTAPEGELFPGIVARLIRTSPDLPCPAPHHAFHPPVGAVAALPAAGLDPLFQKYPPFRCAESVVKRTADGKAPAFEPATYWHLVIPHPCFGDALTQDLTWPQAFAFPLSDLKTPLPVAVELEGLLMIEQNGIHTFRTQTSLPGRLEIGGQGVPLAAGIQTELQVNAGAGLLPFRLILDRRDQAAAAFKIDWRRPSQNEFSPLSGARMVHRVNPAVAAAYVQFSAGADWKRAAPLPKTPPPIPADLDAAALASVVATHKDFAPICQAYFDLWRSPGPRRGSPEISRRLLGLIQARLDAMRRDPRQWVTGAFSKINGASLQQFESLRPFLESCLRLPQLQDQALEVRAGILSFAALIPSRSFFAETHFGTNDGYFDNDNFIVNDWRVARVWDDPIAFDAARCLFDNHFNYGFGTKDAMHADGIICFHASNGRHVNMGGYGDNWITRILSPIHAGTPWGHTPEQCRRMAEFVVAFEWFFYRGAMAFTACGRHNTGKGQMPWGFLDRARKLPGDLLDAGTRAALDDMQDRRAKNVPLVGNRFFFRHLQLVHRRADYYLDVKMNAPLVGGIETFAGATPGNLSFGDGVTTLLRHGDEYFPIHAYNIPESLWRFRSLPGTTQLNLEGVNNDGQNNPDRYRTGAGSRAGGVSDGDYGHCAFEFVSAGPNASRARKFFGAIEDGLVVLGSDIACTKKAPGPHWSVRSNVNQCAHTAPCSVVDAKGERQTLAPEGEDKTLRLPLDRAYWLEHAGIGYLVLPSGAERGPGKPGELVIRSTARTPLNRLPDEVMDNPKLKDWKERCRAMSEGPKARQARVLEIWIDHGGDVVKDAACAYFVCMRPEKKSAAEWLADPGFRILANTPGRQAIHSEVSGLQAFFYQADALKVPGLPEITTAQPLSMMLRGRKLVVQDPLAACTRKLSEMTDRAKLKIDARELDIPLPGAGDADDRYRGGFATINF